VRTGKSGNGKIIAEYIYDDENGNPYHKVERFDNKDFSQYRWVNVKGKPHWVKGAPKGDKVPYLLSALIKTPLDTPVFICEGEKDAETVFDLGLPATTNPNGAGKWVQSLNKWFEGRQTVYVLEDNDKWGRKHVRIVADALQDIVPNIRLIHFRDLPHKGDVTDWVKNYGGTKELLLERAKRARSIKKINIHYDSEAFGAVVDQIQHALFETGQEVFQRAGKLVQPIWTDLPTHRSKKIVRKIKTTLLQPFQIANMRYMISKHAANIKKQKMVKSKDKQTGETKTELKWITVIPPSELIDSLLTLGHWIFPVIAGIVNTPTMRKDGSILSPGYDPETQLWYEKDSDFELPNIKERPTKDDALAALDILKDLICETPFVDEGDRSVALSAILTIATRGAYKVCPMFLFQAHMAGTGKSYLVNIISHIGFGQPCPVTTLDRYEEMQKKLGALVLEGVPIISLDNCSRDIGGDLLCQLVEQPTIKIRILGQSTTPSCPWRGVLFATGNNINVVGDMTRRALVCTLDHKEERPEFHRYKSDPIEMIMENRGKYVAAALTIARAYLYADDIKIEHPIASYEEWANFARKPLIWLGLPDPVTGMEKAQMNDPGRNAAATFFQQWAKLPELQPLEKARKAFEFTQLANRANGALENWEPAYPELYYALAERCIGGNGRIDPTKLGYWLRSLKGQVHAGFRLEASTTLGHGSSWVIKTHNH